MNALFVVSPKGFRDEEFQIPYDAFEKVGIEITVCSKKPGLCVGMLGYSVHAQYSFSDIDSNEFDILFIVGGCGSPHYLWGDEKLHSIVNEMNSKEKLISAICLSTVVLANAGILNGRKVTVFDGSGSINILGNAGAEYIDESVVVDGNIITAQGPEHALQFANILLENAF